MRSIFALFFATAVVADECADFCRSVEGCPGRGSFCKTDHKPSTCFGLFWEDASNTKMCYRPAAPAGQCRNGRPVLCNQTQSSSTSPHPGAKKAMSVSTVKPAKQVDAKKSSVSSTNVPKVPTTTPKAKGSPVSTTLIPVTPKAKGSPVSTTLIPVTPKAKINSVSTTLIPVAPKAKGGLVSTTSAPTTVKVKAKERSVLTTTNVPGVFEATTQKKSAVAVSTNVPRTTLKDQDKAKKTVAGKAKEAEGQLEGGRYEGKNFLFSIRMDVNTGTNTMNVSVQYLGKRYEGRNIGFLSSSSSTLRFPSSKPLEDFMRVLPVAVPEGQLVVKHEGGKLLVRLNGIAIEAYRKRV
jgi:hypothetical protein